jgi:hypothetical protein
MPKDLLYLPGEPLTRPGPLARYLPPVNDGIASVWLARRLPRGSWVLDPFGASPRLTLELAHAGYRLLVAANNPVARFLIEMSAAPPSIAELRAALAELAGAFKGNDRLEPHIRGLYATECARCAQPVMAEAFLWERGASAPYAKLYTCPHCHDQGERPATEADAARAARFASGGLHRARALERVAPLNDPDREHAEEALAVYPARAVYALFTLINKLDGLSLPPERRRQLTALLLSACDQANTLWPHPTARERPRQLVVPPHFRENNVWLALENAIDMWAAPIQPAALTHWPKLPPESGGISLFEGRLKDLAASLSKITIDAVTAALPRPNQAFWTLSALWAGWLWGREAASAFKSVLRRRRYDWAWHTTALTAALDNLAPHLTPGTPFYGLIGEVEPGFLAAALVAADAAGFDLDGLALRPEGGQTQMLWQSEQKSAEIVAPASSPPDLAQLAAAEYLKQRGEPAAYLSMSAAALTGLAQAHVFRNERIQRAVQESLASGEPAEPSLSIIYNQTQAALRETLTYRGGFLRYGAGESPETGHWWLRANCDAAPPLADRLEVELVKYLIKHPGCTLVDLEKGLYELFPGLLTPESEIIHICLESYAEQTPPDSGQWRLRQQDAPAARRAELKEIRRQIQALGERLEFSTSGEIPLIWIDAEGQARYWLYPKASAVIGEIMTAGQVDPERSLIVLPGGRANLVAYKLHRNPHLAQAVTAGWRFLKFRCLRSLLEAPGLTPDTFPEKLEADPLTYSAPQMRLL